MAKSLGASKNKDIPIFFFFNALKPKISPAGSNFPFETHPGLWLGQSKSALTRVLLQPSVQIPLKSTRLFRHSPKGILDQGFGTPEPAAAVYFPPSDNRDRD